MEITVQKFQIELYEAAMTKSLILISNVTQIDFKVRLGFKYLEYQRLFSVNCYT